MKILTLIFFLAAVVICQDRPVTVFLAGDSTCADKLPEKRPETGWGEMFGKHFSEGKVRIENRALNGRSTKTFISEGHWQKIVDDLAEGDWVFVQFGHNDSSKEKGERYTPPDAYRANLIRFIEDVRAKKGNILLLTPVMRRKFDKDNEFVDTHGEYPDIVRSVAKDMKAFLIDMHRKTAAMIKRYGVEGSRDIFLQLKPNENANYPQGIEDNTHFNPKGADEVAAIVVEGMKEVNLTLARYLKK